MQRTVSIAPETYIQAAGGLNPALTKNSRVAGTVIFPMIWGIKNTAQMMRRMLNSLNRLNLSASDIAAVPPGGSLHGNPSNAKSHFLLCEPIPGACAYSLRPLSQASPLAYSASSGGPSRPGNSSLIL